MKGTVTIPKKIYFELCRDQEMLYRLEGGGVDNWTWYGDSINDPGDFDEWEDKERERIEAL